MINAQALIGTKLGTSVLEGLIAQGDTGAVFFAQQLNSQERVVVKILFPPLSAASQAPSLRAHFLERFHQEMAVVASLSHQHILPLYTYGEHQGLPYLVMPYIGGGSLADVLQQEGQLVMPRLLSYLEQVAAALDYAHERGVVHYHLKPGNILLTPEGNVVVAEFGQVNLLAARPTSQMNLLRADTPVGALEYMAPEQLMGDVVDARTDLYTLGVILYQMVTGKTLFQGAPPMQMATMLVQAPPPSPCSLRADLPVAAEQVLLHALAKRSQDRYVRAQDFVNAFRTSLASPGALTANTPANAVFKKRSRGLFDPVWQQSEGQVMPGSGLLTSSPEGPTRPGAPAEQNKPRSTGLLSARNNIAPQDETSPGAVEQAKLQTTTALPLTSTHQASQFAIPPRLEAKSSLLRPASAAEFGSNVTRTLADPSGEAGTSTTDALAATKHVVPDHQSPFPSSYATGALTTGALPIADVEQGSNGTLKLTGAMKVVQVPVAGQPGRYVTGLLPVLPAPAQQEQEAPAGKAWKIAFSKHQKIVAIILLVAVVLSSTGLLWYLHSRSAIPAKNGVQAEHLTADLQAIMAARATATATANTILTDPLTANIHNWPVASKGSKVYLFENDGYHIIDNDPHQSAPAILPDLVLKGPVVYSLTMREVKGNDGSINNSFGMILRLSTRIVGSKSIVAFYCFEVVNNSGGKYEFVKYDSSSKGASPWIPIWQHAFGSEFHQGHGPTRANTFKVATSGKSFTFFVNGKQVGKAADGSLANGEIGMLVNLQGTEVAFSNLLLTYS